jgi:hypothetical protein
MVAFNAQRLLTTVIELGEYQAECLIPAPVLHCCLSQWSLSALALTPPKVVRCFRLGARFAAAKFRFPDPDCGQSQLWLDLTRAFCGKQ